MSAPKEGVKAQAAVAQSVAHLIGSEEVTGSIPVISSVNRSKRHKETRKKALFKGAFLIFIGKVLAIKGFFLYNLLVYYFIKAK